MSPDPFYGAPVLDVDERRTKPSPYRYFRGAFEGTDTRGA